MKLPNIPVRQSDVRRSADRRTASILLYGFGLALALSLVFNGFLLYEKSHLERIRAAELSDAYQPIDNMVWQQELSECRRANEQKDSLILRLAQAPNAPPGETRQGPAIAVQHPPSNR
ncbi:hypothetical protein [Spirosoma rhododendri]|uniref:hypothetical protein n=1 Tax=Spirosoma rhododendri TaxID=2728024 RepID=UPI0020C4D626|nr:hypothetical protein [Spirosoma rhododendri]